MPRFIRKPQMVEAIQLKQPMTIDTLEGTLIGQTGDWLVTGPTGEQHFVKPYVFNQEYEREGGSLDTAPPFSLAAATPPTRQRRAQPGKGQST